MTNLNDKYVVEYSVKGGTTHIHTIKEMLTANARNVLDGMSNDYIPVAIADTSEEAMKAADMLEKTIADRKAK